MKRVLLNVVFLMIAPVFGAYCQSSSIAIKVKYMDGGKISQNTVVYLLYQEPGNTELVEKEVSTGSGNVVSFVVPLDKDGASYPFVVLFTKEEVDKVKEMVKSSTIRAYRTPPGEKCEFLELTATKGGGTRNDGCAIQMWSMGK